MGSGDLKIGHMNFHIHSKRDSTTNNNIPKGCLAVTVGIGAEQQRFVIPVMYFNHPLFLQLLKGAEEEYQFKQIGPINIPCHVEEFCEIRGLIDKEKETTSLHVHQQHHISNHHHNHFLCFKA